MPDIADAIHARSFAYFVADVATVSVAAGGLAYLWWRRRTALKSAADDKSSPAATLFSIFILDNYFQYNYTKL